MVLPTPCTFPVATWNVDCDSPHIYLRTRAVADALLAAAPDVVALQEVSAVPISRWRPETLVSGSAAAHPRSTSLHVLESRLASKYEAAYDVGEAADAPYFVASFVRRDRFRVRTHEYTAYERSAQGRGVLSVLLAERRSGQCVRFFTSHFESGREGAALRKEQMTLVARMMARSQSAQLERAAATRDANDGSGVIDDDDDENGYGCDQNGLHDARAAAVPAVFAGDTNLRASEVSARLVHARNAVGRVGSDKLHDAFAQCGEPAHARFTWDTQRNANRVDSFPPHVRPRARYDRVWLSRGLRAVSVALLGEERLAVGVHPSDHFGMCVRCEVVAPGDDGVPVRTD